MLREAHFAYAMRNDDGVPDVVAQLARHYRTDDDAFGIGKGLARRKAQRLPMAVAVVFEVTGVGAEYAKALVRIPQ